MHAKGRKICEVLLGTGLVAPVTIMLAWILIIFTNWHGQGGPGDLLAGFLGGIVFILIAMGVYVIPSAFVVSLVIASLRRWSASAIAAILFTVVVCSSVSSYMIDPTQSRREHGCIGYFTRFDWFASPFDLLGIVSGSVASLIAFWAVQRCRRRYETLA